MDDRTATLAKFLRYGFATGSSSALALVGTVVLARVLGPPTFVVINLAVLTGTTVAQFANGADSAAARQIAAKLATSDIATIWAFRWRVILLILSAPVAAVIFSTILPDLGGSAISLLVLSTVGTTAALSAMSVILIEPQAVGDSYRFAVYQFIYYLPFFIACLACYHFKTLESAALTLASSSGLSIAVFAVLFGPKHNVRSAFRPASSYLGTRRYRILAWTMTGTGLLYTVGERIDVYLVTAGFSELEAANYALAVRLAGTFAVLVGAVQAMNVSTLGRATTTRELQQTVIGQWPIATLVLVGVITLSAAAPLLDQPVFGNSYQLSSAAVLLLGFTFVLYALYSPYVLALAALGFNRYLATVTSIGFIVKVAVALIALATHEILLLYASSACGAGAAIIYVVSTSGRVSSSDTSFDASREPRND